MATTLEQNVNTRSRPSDLKITDVRIANLAGIPMRVTIIRIDTNQGLVGYGEVRDGASKTYALLLKRHLVGENPCNIDKIFRKIKQFGFHGRQAGGVCGVEMALFDLAGKAYGVPAYQLAGGKFRDKVLCYSDTPSEADGTEMGRRLKARMDQGFKFLKMDVGIQLLLDIPGAIIAPPEMISSRSIMHQFTGIQITDVGIGILCDYVAAVRDEKGSYKIYINGELDNAVSKTQLHRIENFRIGWSSSDGGSNEQLAEFRIWNRERSAAEIRANFDRSLANSKDPSLLFNGSGDVG